MNDISGGRKHNTGELFYTPTILTDVGTEMECFKDEIFGPVIAIKRFKSEKVRSESSSKFDNFHHSFILVHLNADTQMYILPF